MVQSCLRYFFEYGSNWKTLMIFCQNTVLIKYWVFHKVISNFTMFFQKRFLETFYKIPNSSSLFISWIEFICSNYEKNTFLHWTKLHPPSFANINFGQSYIVSLIDQPFKAAVQAGNVGCATLFRFEVLKRYEKARHQTSHLFIRLAAMQCSASSKMNATYKCAIIRYIFSADINVSTTPPLHTCNLGSQVVYVAGVFSWSIADLSISSVSLLNGSQWRGAFSRRYCAI